MENATADGVAGDQAEETFDLIDPGGRCGREVEVEAGVALEPSLDLGVLVRCVVVDDEMQIEQFGGVAVDGAQEAQEFLMAWRLMLSPMTLPVATSSAANKVVVPWRL